MGNRFEKENSDKERQSKYSQRTELRRARLVQKLYFEYVWC